MTEQAWIWDVLDRPDADVIVREGRDWLAECVWADLDVDTVEDAVSDLMDVEVLAMVDTHYGGGLGGFLLAVGL